MDRAQPSCIAKDGVVCLSKGPTLSLVDEEYLVRDLGVVDMLLEDVEGVDSVFTFAFGEGPCGSDQGYNGFEVDRDTPAAIEVC